MQFLVVYIRSTILASLSLRVLFFNPRFYNPDCFRVIPTETRITICCFKAELREKTFIILIFWKA